MFMLVAKDYLVSYVNLNSQPFIRYIGLNCVNVGGEISN